MKIKNMNKKGELSTEQIILIIVLIASFAVIIFFLVRLNLGKQSVQDVCHDSVLKKTSTVTSSISELQCSRQYICITQSGKCPAMSNPDIVQVKTSDEVYGELAKDMADCWWMFGEGKVNYVDSTMLKHNYCSICSQIMFDDSLKKIKGFEDGNISKDKLYNYLATNNFSTSNGKKMTYSQYMLGTNNISQFKNLKDENGNSIEASFGKIKIGQEYFVVMGITSSVSTAGWALKIGGAAAAGVVLITCTGITAGGCAAVATIGGTAILGGAAGVGGSVVSNWINPEVGAIVVDGKGIDNKFMTPTIQQANEKEYNALNCEDTITRT